MLSLELKPVEKEIFHSDTAFVGTFRCGSDHPLFRNSGACNSNTIVFPRTATLIHRSRRDSFVADPNTVVVYNKGDEYTREKISPIDSCDWYVLADDLLHEMIDARKGGKTRTAALFRSLMPTAMTGSISPSDVSSRRFVSSSSIAPPSRKGSCRSPGRCSIGFSERCRNFRRVPLDRERRSKR
jgi:hypothetical protein